MENDVYVAGGKNLPSKFVKPMPVFDKKKWAQMDEERQHLWQIIALHPELKLNPNLAMTVKNPKRKLQKIREALGIQSLNSSVL